VWFNAYGVPSDYEADRLRLTPAQAREAVREFVRTGHRPTCVQWETEHDDAVAA
jgi:phage portal protein BeeE